jgi:hypothetical protein
LTVIFGKPAVEADTKKLKPAVVDNTEKHQPVATTNAKQYQPVIAANIHPPQPAVATNTNFKIQLTEFIDGISIPRCDCDPSASWDAELFKTENSPKSEYIPYLPSDTSGEPPPHQRLFYPSLQHSEQY